MDKLYIMIESERNSPKGEIERMYVPSILQGCLIAISFHFALHE